MNFVNYSLLFIFKVYWILNSNYVFAKDLPLVLRNLKCQLNKDFDACFLRSANKGIPLIAKGDPEYGIPNMVPLKIVFMNLIDTTNLHVNLTNIEVHGLDKMKMIDYKSQLENNSFTLTLKGENITIVGNYEADGKILIMPLNGKGRFSFYFKNGIYAGHLSADRIEKNGEKYFKPSKVVFKTKFEKIVFHLENLFEGNKQLGDQVNLFLNENWESLVADFGPGIERNIAEIINEVFGNIARVVPISFIF